jgi:hypothetical protein
VAGEVIRERSSITHSRAADGESDTEACAKRSFVVSMSFSPSYPDSSHAISRTIPV